MGNSATTPCNPVSLPYEKSASIAANGLSRSSIYHNPLQSKDVETPTSHLKTLWDIFQTGVKMNPTKSCLGQREQLIDGSFGCYQWLTYREVEQLAVQMGTSLWRFNLCPFQNFPDEHYSKAQTLRPLGIFAKNCAEWLIIEQSCNAFGFTLVPLYDTLGQEALIWIAEQTQLSCIVVSTGCLEALNQVIAEMKSVKAILLLDIEPWMTTTIPDKNDSHRIKFNESFSHLLSCYKLQNDFISKRPDDDNNMIQSFSTESTSDATLSNNVVNPLSQTEPSITKNGTDRQLSSTHSQVNLYMWSDLQTFGSINTLSPIDVDPASVQTLCFTSGTTGTPKGVIITHNSILASFNDALRECFVGSCMEINSNDVHFCYLPLAHLYARMFVNLSYGAGASIGIYSKNILKLFEDIKLLRPTFFNGVPRIFARLIDQIETGIAGKSYLAQQIFQQGVTTKLRNLKSGNTTNAFWDKYMFQKLNEEVFGGRVRFFTCGGAPLDEHIEQMLQVLFCAPLLQAYGLTETTGAAFSKLPGDGSTGNVGGCVPWAEFCLESVPELNMDAQGNPARGEILVRGVGVSEGYFRQKELTDEVFKEDGWFHTGDIGMILPSGALKIIDRKKDIFKLAQGEYISPEKIEAVYNRCSLISQIFVHGQSDKNFLVGVVVPDPAIQVQWVQENKLEQEYMNDVGSIDVSKLTLDERFIKAVMNQLAKAETQHGLMGFERVKTVKFSQEPFTVNNGLITPTFKLRRLEMKNRFKVLIDEMYK